GGKGGDQPVTLGLTCIRRDTTDDGRASPDPLVGEVRAFTFDTKVPNWLPCNGSEISISANVPLFSVIQDAFGGDGTKTFAVPDLRSRTALGGGDPEGLPAVAVGDRGDGVMTGGEGRRVRLHLNFCICTRGDYPNRPGR